MIPHLPRAALVLVIAAGVSACGSGSGSGPTSSSPPAQNAAAGGGARTIAVTEKEFSITVHGASNVRPGSDTFDVTNAGQLSHNLTVTGPGVQNAATPTFAGGGTRKLTVRLQKGTYTLFCSVPGHRQQGMVTTLKVA